MRHSLQLRLLGLSLAVATLGIVATALLATYSTGSQLREELESSVSLLETDSYIRSTLLEYARENDNWQQVDPLVRELADRTGRRIVLTTVDGEPFVDSAHLLGQRAGELPTVPAARINAAMPAETLASFEQGDTPPFLHVSAPDAAVRYVGWWRMTEQEWVLRQALADSAVDCLGRGGIDASISVDGDNVRVLYNQMSTTYNEDSSWQEMLQSCVPDELYAPTAATRELNERTVELATACLRDRGLEYEISVDPYGMRVAQPSAENDVDALAWAQCEESAHRQAIGPFVAAPADLYLGTSDRFDPFSPQGWWRTAMTTAIILLVAAAITVVAGRRLISPIRALTTAAQRMESGDRSARVAVNGTSEVTHLAHAFNAMAESIENSDRQRRALVNDVAHELRNPLANIRSHLEAVEDDVLPLDTDLVQSLLEESVLLERLVGDLQDLALADAGMLTIHPEEREATDLAEQAVAAHRVQADASGVAIGLDAPASIPVRADPARLRQALGNLVSNAVTHTPDGGVVEVAVRGSEEWVVFTVTDTGAGIAPEHLPHVFDRFYRADPSRSRATGGSGLGLAITKHLIDVHGGSVDAVSTPGEGSVFTIRLPRVRGDE